jgi:hypothetical protein
VPNNCCSTQNPQQTYYPTNGCPPGQAAAPGLSINNTMYDTFYAHHKLKPMKKNIKFKQKIKSETEITQKGNGGHGKFS